MSSAAGSSTPTGQDDSTPLWKYVKKIDKIGVGGGNCRFQCNYCQLLFKGSYTRVKSHLLRIPGQGIRGCSKVTPQDIQGMQRLVDQELKVKKNCDELVPLPPPAFSAPSSCSSASSGFGASAIGSSRQEVPETKKRKGSECTSMEKASKVEAKEHLDAEIARMFYSAGLPFQLAQNPFYISSYSFAAKNLISGYRPPDYNMLKTTLLQKEKVNIERLLQPIKNTWREKGISIVIGGWTDKQQGPLLNFMAVSEDWPIFLKAINCEGRYEDENSFATWIKDTVAEVGPQHVVQVITNNAPVCRAAGMLIEAQYPHIFWTPCVVETINLAIRNICEAKDTEDKDITYDECRWITNIVVDTMVIKKFIIHHSMRTVIFKLFANFKMLAIVDTRFASVIVMLKRFKLIKSDLESMVNSDKWACFQDDNVEKAQFVKQKVLDDLWWGKIDYILSFMDPIYQMLRISATNKPCLHLVYDMWDSVIEKVKVAIYQHEARRENEDSTFFSVVHKILVGGWNKSSTPLHCLAHSLNPRYYSTVWLNEAPNRVAPHKDVEISVERNKCLKRYFANPEERRKVNIEFARFSASLDEFADRDSLHDRGILDPKIWWIIYGSSMPRLQSLAIKLLGQPCSLSCCVRNWSSYSFINLMKRKNVNSQCVEDLVFVHTNLHLLSRRNLQYMQGESKMWDVGGDAFESFEGAGVLEIAALSLDEPDLEAVVFSNEGYGDDVEPINVGSN